MRTPLTAIVEKYLAAQFWFYRRKRALARKEGDTWALTNALWELASVRDSVKHLGNIRRGARALERQRFRESAVPAGPPSGAQTGGFLYSRNREG